MEPFLKVPEDMMVDYCISDVLFLCLFAFSDSGSQSDSSMSSDLRPLSRRQRAGRGRGEEREKGRGAAVERGRGRGGKANRGRR